MKEEEDLWKHAVEGPDAARAKSLSERTVRPILPEQHSREMLRQRMTPQDTVVLTCGNPQAMADVRRVAEMQAMHFEMEEW
jgi:hypothetical protein